MQHDVMGIVTLYVHVTEPPVCSLRMFPSYTGGVLDLFFNLNTSLALTWNVFMNVGKDVVPLWSLALPPIHPRAGASYSIPGFPFLGTISFDTTLTTADGNVICSDHQSLNTAPVR